MHVYVCVMKVSSILHDKKRYLNLHISTLILNLNGLSYLTYQIGIFIFEQKFIGISEKVEILK